MKKRTNKNKRLRQVITDYDTQDSSFLIDPSQRLSLKDLGLLLPELPPTQVVSLRLPSELLNELRAIGSAQDIPYQALIKLLLAEGVTQLKKKVA